MHDWSFIHEHLPSQRKINCDGADFAKDIKKINDSGVDRLNYLTFGEINISTNVKSICLLFATATSQ
jgi:hypothetical protein